MQRETLYNLLRTAFFIVAVFAFKMVKILSDQISTVRKDNNSENFSFFLFHLFTPIQIVELLMLHLVIYFVFLNKRFEVINKEKTHSACIDK